MFSIPPYEDNRSPLKRAWLSDPGDEWLDVPELASNSLPVWDPLWNPTTASFDVQESGLPMCSRNPNSSDVQPSSDREFVCYGSITDIKAQVLSEHRHSLRQITNGANTLIFSVVQEGPFFALEFSDRRFARLSKHACEVARAMKAERHVIFQAVVSDVDWKSAIRSYESNRSAKCILTLELNIYGAKDDAQVVGCVLSAQKTYLQFPQSGCGGEYYNPHFFRLDGYSDQIPTLPSRDHPSSLPSVEPQARGEDPKASDSAVVDSILNSLAHRVDIANVRVDRRIKSPLLPHQKEGIDFISGREQGNLASNISLWQYNDVDADVPFYQHLLTGAKRPERSEEKGGIIADEMGLGKSLVILSTIVGSLERGESFVNAVAVSSNSPSSTKMRTKATLVVAPSSLLIDSWVDEIYKHAFTGAISFHRHIGSARHAEKDLLQTSMIVFTTYATVAAEVSRGNSILSQLHWFRIVLDEAHDIRNNATKQFQAISSLSAEHRWCLTGTPIQNSLEDLGALTTFLKVPILEHAPTFRKVIINPILSESGPRNDRFKNLRLLLQSLCLRRTRELLDLPEPIVQERRLQLSSQEQIEYRNLLSNCRRDIDRAVSGRGKGRINSTVLESLLKLRLYCNNGSLNDATSGSSGQLPADPDEMLSLLQQMNKSLCSYCFGAIYSINASVDTDGGILLPSCMHLVCRTCIAQYHIHKQQCPACARGEEMPLCGNYGSTEQPSQSAYTSRQISYPTKLRALYADISLNRFHKSIIFSSWKKTLTLFGQLLTSNSTRYAMIDGSLSLSERLKVLKDFRSPSGANILLMTLGTGAVGLNLAVASRIYLLEPQWNPMIESQAIGRALRLGQTAEVVITRYIMKDTIEESNVLSRQKTKLQLAGSGFGKSKGESSEQLRAMLDIFGIQSTS